MLEDTINNLMIVGLKIQIAAQCTIVLQKDFLDFHQNGLRDLQI